MYVGFFPSVPGAYTQAKTLDDLNIRMKEVLELCLETMSKKERNEIPEFVGTQQISVAV
jgi:predicted RNase H-like HicB family nuclease